MIWFLKTRRVAFLAGAVAAQTILLALVGDSRIPVPSLLRASTVPVAFTVFAPLIANSAFLYGLEKRDVLVERSATRPLPLFDVVLYVALCTLLVVLGLAGDLAGSGVLMTGARNALGYLGLGLLVSRFAGPRAGSLVPAAYAVLLGVFNSGRDVGICRWPLAGLGSRQAAAIVVVLFASALAATLVPSSKAVAVE